MNLAAIYRAAGRELRSMLLGIDLENIDGTEAMNIYNKTRRIVETLHLTAERWTGSDLMKAYQVGAKKAKIALEILGKKPKRPPITDPKIGIREEAYTVLFRSNRSILKTIDNYLAAALLASKELKYSQLQAWNFEDAADLIEGIAAEAVKTGASRGVLKRQILAYLRGLVEDQNFIEINGKFYKVGKYAEMVARTELRNAATKATKELCREYDNDLVEVSSHGTDCDICIEFEGNIYSISGTHPRYPALTEEPPYHPNCLHSLLPTSEEAIGSRGKYA